LEALLAYFSSTQFAVLSLVQPLHVPQSTEMRNKRIDPLTICYHLKNALLVQSHVP
jgi:hypothetical protein